MIEYFTIAAAVIALISIKSDFQNKNLIFLIIIFPMSILDGLRWEMGTDWISYYSYFTDANIDIGRSFDPGFLLYTDLFKSVTDNYSVYLLSISLFTYFGIFYGIFIITEKNFLSMFYLIGTLPWYAGSLRQMIAVVFFVWALKAVIDREPLKYIILMLLGISFHATLILFSLIYIFYGISTVSYIALFLFIIACLPFLSGLLNVLQFIVDFYGFKKNVLQYAGGTLHLSNPILGGLRKILTISGLFVFSTIAGSSINTDYYKWQKIKYFLALSSLSIIFYYIGAYQISHVSSRVDLYVSIIATSILIGLIDNSINKKTTKIIFYIFICSLVGVFYYRLMWLDLFHPYSSIFYNYDLHRQLH